jgi:hypothetical protein
VAAKQLLQPLDRIAVALIVVLCLLIGILVWSGDRTVPRVRDFTWQDKQIGSEDTAFLLTFSRPMAHASVEANLKIEPLLPGKISWAGRKMAYTLLKPAPYGNKYDVHLEKAYEQFAGSRGKQQGNPIAPFAGTFRVRDRAFAYIGIEGEEKGRLILYNLTQQRKTALTPATLVVNDFKLYPQGDRILFSAAEWADNKPGVFKQQLYAVTTGLNPQSPDEESTVTPAPPGKIDLVLDSKDYQNMRFDLSADGQTIVVQRLNRQNLSEFGLWILRPNTNTPPTPLGDQPGGDFLIQSDGQSLAIAQEQGVAILSLVPGQKPLEFLPGFGQVLNFARDGSAAMVKFNPDSTRSLVYDNNQGVRQEVFRTQGSILDAKFDSTVSTLYCLLTELQLLKGEDGKDQYQEQPYLAAIDLKTKKLKPLLLLPQQRDIQMSIAPDGLALMFDQPIASTASSSDSTLTTSDGQPIATSRLWLLPLTPSKLESAAPLQPEELPLPGFRPRWLP